MNTEEIKNAIQKVQKAKVQSVLASMGSLPIQTRVGFTNHNPKYPPFPPRVFVEPVDPEVEKARRDKARADREARDQQIAAEKKARKLKENEQKLLHALSQKALSKKRKGNGETRQEQQPQQPEKIDLSGLKGIFPGMPLWPIYVKWLAGRKPSRKTFKEFKAFWEKKQEEKIPDA